ncbi:hypothetical protein DW1_0071 [Proteiniborus sp. DW1]|uniref:DUF4179 domain-containing protein n=1 Tax=Proteiniborus sp. DW1 TaxID=1889883 RepID=UPI00092DF408|nr:DUF4179 domain-containing protein [Proteiniborus sp. DW1]SCG81692.1 hypothetical protein DW1_0071 [Proteiniborus sp. DW1]
MKNSKNIYELLNQVEFNIDDYEKVELSDIEKKKLKQRFKEGRRKRLDFKKLGAITAALALTIGVFSQTSVGKSVYASAQSKITEISYSIGRALGIERNIEPYENIVNQIVENKGVEIKLTGVIIDKDELILSTIVNTNKPVDGFFFDYDIYINGKKLRDYGMTGSSGAIDDSKTIFFTANSFDVKGIDLYETLDIKVVLKNLHYYLVGESDEEIKGKWEFEFTASGNELATTSYTLPLDYSFDIDNTTYILEEFRYNPVNQKIFGKLKNQSTDSYQVDLRGHDNLGNEVIFFLTSVSGEELVFKYENIYGDLADEITSITLTPYAAKLPEESGRMSNDYKQVGEEFTIILK